MTKAEFQTALHQVLAAHASHAARQIQLILDRIPANARALYLQVFTNQDADGGFDVYASLEGPDLYVLNKAIRNAALIFGVKNTPIGVVPAVPMLDSGTVDFAVNDAIVDVVTPWLRVVWDAVGAPAHGIPVSVVGHDGYGTVTPLKLRG